MARNLLFFDIFDIQTHKQILINLYKQKRFLFLKKTSAKGGIMSEDIGQFLPLPKNIPKNYLKLSYPVHGNDKVLQKFNRLHVKKYYSYEIKI